jgi:hypothetical protein
MSLCYYSRMLKGILAISIIGLFSGFSVAQNATQKIVDAEHAFAKRALEVGGGPSFVEFMTDDAFSFVPDVSKGKAYWTAQKPDGTILEWAPNYADAAVDGSFGYTSGNWQYREKKGAEPSAFGEFNTIWVQQPDKSYKWLVDIGIGHEKPAEYSTKVVLAPATGGRHPSPPSFDMQLFDREAGKDARNAYGKFAAADIRMTRRGRLPIIGAAAVKNEISGKMTFGDAIATKRAEDMAFVLRPYTLGDEKGNQLQVWKYDHKLAGWTIVLDVLKPVPQK